MPEEAAAQTEALREIRDDVRRITLEIGGKGGIHAEMAQFRTELDNIGDRLEAIEAKAGKLDAIEVKLDQALATKIEADKSALSLTDPKAIGSVIAAIIATLMAVGGYLGMDHKSAADNQAPTEVTGDH